ncbi:MAG: polysaccharide deacetylase family protein, partial [Chloroflexi bacterium]
PNLLPTPIGPYSWTLKVPILMYHYISVPPADADIYRYDLSVEPDNFRAQMAYLAENGYTTIDLYDLSLAITNKKELPPKPVILTFDDGYRDNYENAFPVLQEFGLKGTFFVVTEFVDRGLEAYMTWPMLEEMAAAGQRIEPHSKTHADLRNRDRDFLIWEILGSQETIAAHIGYTPRYFAYPGGRYDDAVIQILRELDYWGAVTTISGKWHGFADRYEWTRLRVRHDTTLAEFADLIDPGDTVGGKPQGNN